MEKEKIFVEGLYYNAPREGAPDFVVGSLSIDPKRLVEFLRKQVDHIDDKGYIKFDLLKSRDGDKVYAQVNTWKPEQKDDKEIPF